MAAQTETKEKKASTTKNFFQGVKSEYRKIVWPGWKTLLNYSVVVIVISILVSLLVWGLDEVFRTLVSLLVK
ncbi:preprotein translocase, SecE subunit [Peptostreptococcaceae bacterium oral taxon 113 str. W5053]|nr:preprotein translocase, SecE subunit [Peptostreptococcaceae bacterium oral taxon 113 str. W5053]